MDNFFNSTILFLKGDYIFEEYWHFIESTSVSLWPRTTHDIKGLWDKDENFVDITMWETKTLEKYIF